MGPLGEERRQQALVLAAAAVAGAALLPLWRAVSFALDVGPLGVRARRGTQATPPFLLITLPRPPAHRIESNRTQPMPYHTMHKHTRSCRRPTGGIGTESTGASCWGVGRRGSRGSPSGAFY